MKFKHYLKNYSEIFVYLGFKLFLPKINNYNNYLLIINTGYIGDLVVSSILFENPKIFKEYNKIVFLVKKQYLELFANYNGRIKFVGYDEDKYRFSILYKYKFLSSLRFEAFKTCIHLTAARGILNEEITHLSGAKELIALNSFWEYLGKYLGNYFDSKYSLIIAKNTLNEYQKHFELIEKFNSDKIEVVFNAGNTFDENNFFKLSIFNDLSDFILIAPFTSKLNREWKSDYFKEVISSLKKEHQIVLIGTEKQKNRIEKLYVDNKNIINLTGKLALNELPHLIKKAKLYIGMDSGTTHLALKLNIPLVAIIGGGEFGRFFPFKESSTAKYLYSKMDCFSCHWQCSKSEMFCITEVNPEIVINEAIKILSVENVI